MVTFFTSDLHFGHRNIIDYCRRPFASVEEMNAALVERWNARVGHDDEVWVLGDACLGDIDDSLRCVAQLNGTKRLVVGNHDRMFKADRRDEWERRYRDAGFASFFYGHLLFPGEPQLLLCHFPYRGDSGGTDRFVDERPSDEGLPLLHGHVHERWRKNGRMTNVGVDAWGGYPVPLDALLTLADDGGSLAPLGWD